MQLHYYIDTTPNFCTTLTKPDNVNYVYTYLPVYHYCYCYYTDSMHHVHLFIAYVTHILVYFITISLL